MELTASLYQVTSRGDRREAIFRDDQDRAEWLIVLGEVCSRYNWRCHAYCGMTNHYHVVVETPDVNLSQGMRQLNRHHGLVGHLFQGRYQGILVERDAYLLELSRYVVLNPVRARIVADAAAWAWSTYRAMIGLEQAPPWLETDWILGQFGAERGRAQAQYCAFVAQGVGQPSIWEGLRHQIFLGSEAFVERLAQASRPLDRLREVPRAQRRPLAQSLGH
jgi:putative transposase